MVLVEESWNQALPWSSPETRTYQPLLPNWPRTEGLVDRAGGAASSETAMKWQRISRVSQKWRPLPETCAFLFPTSPGVECHPWGVTCFPHQNSLQTVGHKAW